MSGWLFDEEGGRRRRREEEEGLEPLLIHGSVGMTNLFRRVGKGV